MRKVRQIKTCMWQRFTFGMKNRTNLNSRLQMVCGDLMLPPKTTCQLWAGIAVVCSKAVLLNKAVMSFISGGYLSPILLKNLDDDWLVLGNQRTTKLYFKTVSLEVDKGGAHALLDRLHVAGGPFATDVNLHTWHTRVPLDNKPISYLPISVAEKLKRTKWPVLVLTGNH